MCLETRPGLVRVRYRLWCISNVQAKGKLSVLARVRAFLDRHIDYPAALAGAVVLGSLVFAVNCGHGWNQAAVAAAKQATYTFFAGGALVRLNERLALTIDPAAVGMITGVVCSGALAVSLTYCVHSLRGTPEPLYSTLPTLFLVVPGFVFLGARARYKARLVEEQEGAR